LLAYMSTEKEPAALYILGLLMSTGILFADLINLYYTFTSKKEPSTATAYKEWCMATLLTFDLCIVGLWAYIASYQPKITRLVKDGINRAKWEMHKKKTPVVKKVA
jgi:heme/copper-type cytochrome/quinol oxidase subunit 3